MKKFFNFLIALYVLVLIKFICADYNISYKLRKFDIKEKATSEYIYLEIKYKDNVYNYMFNTGRKFTKKLVKDIKVKKNNGYVCLKPSVKGLESYYVCSDGNELVSLDVVNNRDNYSTFNDNVKYYNNLDSNENVFIWKYDGFYFLNGDDYKSINILNNDRYSNDLMMDVNGYLIFPYYDNNYLFNDFVVLDMETGEYEIIKTDYKINYDSYIVGNRKNSIYLFDNKELILYEINYKKEKVEIVGDEKKGYIKYVDGRKKDAVSNDYVKDKITYFDNIENYRNVSNNYLSYSMNKDLKLKYFIHDDISVIDSNSENLFFIYKDKLYRYNLNKGSEMVFHYFEFNFNSKNNIFIYNK